ncbi:MAG: hypothetical protein IJZ12_04285 [Clostridia bacterium]|nr:hypothetical protein [Clostridia bacterium]
MYRKVKAKLENTIFEAREENGRILSYRISPAEGYKLHEITLDECVNEIGEIKPGFTKSYITAGAGYDFEKNERQIYAEEVKE